MLKPFFLQLYLVFWLFLSAGMSTREVTAVESTTKTESELQFISPSQRFFCKHSLEKILSTLTSQGIKIKELPLFQKLVEQETDGFIGYHGGCSDYRLFQDLIRFVIEEVLDIYIRDDFHFLRIPGMEDLNFDTAEAFLNDNANEIDDTVPYIQQHLLSLNIALFQFYDWPLDLTPRYFIENKTSARPDYWKLLLKFVETIGLDPKEFEPIFALGRSYLPQDRGILIQFFSGNEDASPHSFVDAHFYAAYSGGKPYGIKSPSYYLKSASVNDFPQLRLVINNKNILNPFSSFLMKRYDTYKDEQRHYYEAAMRHFIRCLAVDTEKRKSTRDALLLLWSR